MPGASLFIVIAVCLGQITCAELDPRLKRCPDGEFHNPGYSLSCTYTCKSGDSEDKTEYWGNYRDATVCVVLENGDPDKFKHIGTCQNGKCVQYEGENIDQVWSQLPQLQDQFHRCPPLKKVHEEPVDNCLYICLEIDDPRGPGYFYGVYEDYHPCKFSNGIGRCRSGRCLDAAIVGPLPEETEA
uniref:Putative basic tail protein n=1 Tax=Ixodes ricinus TaxID=34613 RepID=A0A0K8RGL9_IXORI